jgi:hypothetical protein
MRIASAVALKTRTQSTFRHSMPTGLVAQSCHDIVTGLRTLVPAMLFTEMKGAPGLRPERHRAH